MLSKEKFVEIVNELQKLDERQDRLCDAMEDISPDFTVYFYPLNRPIEMVINLLSEMFNQTTDSVIDYYAFELDWGKKGDEMGIYEDNGVEYHLTDAEKLYDYLVKDIK